MKKPTGLFVCLSAGALTACSGGGLEDNRHATGSQVMSTSSSYAALYVANTDANSVSVLDLNTTNLNKIGVGAEPTRITRANDLVFVTLRGERKVEVLRETNGSLTPETKIDVGAEPFGIVASEDGTKVYVASSLSGRVDEIDVATLSIERSWSVADEPRWLALHPSNNALYVASAMNGTLSYIDLSKDGVVEQLDMPEATSQVFSTNGPSTVVLGKRITGDPAVSPNGHFLVVPTLYIDNSTPIDTENPPPSVGYYGGNRFSPSAMVLEVASDGAPVGDSKLILLTGPKFNGYPASITFEPSSEVFLATLEGASAVLAVPISHGNATRASVFDAAFGNPNAPSRGSSFDSHLVQNIKTTGAGPRGVTLAGDGQAFIYSFLDQKVSSVPYAPLLDNLNSGNLRQFSDQFDFAQDIKRVEDEVLPSDVELGRRLFYASNDEGMSASFTGLSCATCHFDGRNDGMTWSFMIGDRNTPSLAGQVSLTEPVRWAGDRETVAIDAKRTAADAMGGTGKSDEDFERIATFVDFTRDTDHAMKNAQSESIDRGREIFHREETACASCHLGDRLTDNKDYPMFGMENVQTRALIGVAATAPYLHDGSAPTLRDVVLRSRDGSMGNTGSLTNQEIDDLTNYLESL